jgi:hypothetical protein
MESRHEYTKGLRHEIPALESTWSAVERNVLMLGRRRLASEAPLPPLPEPRGAAATQNWLDQRRAQGPRVRGWVERLPAALAILRSLDGIEAFGQKYWLPDADKQRGETLRSQMRQAILRQDLAVMDSLLRQIQATLTHDGQRRTDLVRIVHSRIAAVMSLLDAHAEAESTSVPEVHGWDVSARESAATLRDALTRWDVAAARAAEARLNALADMLPHIRARVEAELREAAAAVAARESKCRERAGHRAMLANELAAGDGMWRSIMAGRATIAALGSVGACVGLGLVAAAVAFDRTPPWYGLGPLATLILFAVIGAGVGTVAGTRGLHRRRRAVAKEAAALDRQLVTEANELKDLQTHAASLDRILTWFRL